MWRTGTRPLCNWVAHVRNQYRDETQDRTFLIESMDSAKTLPMPQARHHPPHFALTYTGTPLTYADNSHYRTSAPFPQEGNPACETQFVPSGSVIFLQTLVV